MAQLGEDVAPNRCDVILNSAISVMSLIFEPEEFHIVSVCLVDSEHVKHSLDVTHYSNLTFSEPMEHTYQPIHGPGSKGSFRLVFPNLALQSNTTRIFSGFLG